MKESYVQHLLDVIIATLTLYVPAKKLKATIRMKQTHVSRLSFRYMQSQVDNWKTATVELTDTLLPGIVQTVG